MRIKLLLVGKTADAYLEDGIGIYEKRLKNYIGLDIVVIPDVKNAKNMSKEQLMQREAELILKEINPQDTFVLLDERGTQHTSVEFARYIEKCMIDSVQTLIFLVGGAYGAHETVKNRANKKLSLSAMTFSHQMARLFFVEQLYRAFSIIRGEPYHHE